MFVMEDKENQFCVGNVKEFRNFDVPLQKSKLHETFDYRYKQRMITNESTLIGDLTKQTLDTKIHLSFANPMGHDAILPQNLFHHCNSISHVDGFMIMKQPDHDTSQFTNICEQLIDNLPTYKKGESPQKYVNHPQVLIEGQELASLLETIQRQNDELQRLKRKSLNVSCMQSKIMEETKFQNMKSLNRNQSTQATRNTSINSQLTLLQRLRQP